MIRNTIVALLTLGLASAANADLRPYIFGDLGYADADYQNNTLYLSLGGGIALSDYFDVEVGYNRYGDVGPFGIEVDSLSYGVNVGGYLSEGIKLFASLGAEELNADDEVNVGSFRVSVDESSTEFYFGAGASFELEENVRLRARLISHDSSELVTLSIGVSVLF